MSMNESAKHVFDVAAVTTAIATFVAWLPPMAAAASLVWTLIRIYETKTVQNWLNRRRAQAQVDAVFPDGD